MEPAPFLNLVKNHGFLHISSRGSLVFVMPGYIVVSFAMEKQVHGLRWSFLTNENVLDDKVSQMLSDILRDQPAMQSTMYKQLFDGLPELTSD